MLLNRQYVTNPHFDSRSVPAANIFTLASYNILADCHAQRSPYEWISREDLSLPARHRRMMQELRYLDADIVCLQEVAPDHFHAMLLPQLRELGYDGVFIKRTNEYFNEGEATFYRRQRFQLTDTRRLVLSQAASKEIEASGLDGMTSAAVRKAIDSPGVALLTQLKCIATGKTLSVANIHVMWDWFKRQDLQCVQVATTIRELVSMAGGADAPHVICGDFNAWPGSPPIQLTQEGYLNDQSMAHLQQVHAVEFADGRKAPLVNLWWKGFQHTSSSLKSAYATVLGEDPKSSKFPHDGGVRAVDYIWVACPRLALLGVLRTAPEAVLRGGIPSRTFPSDHLSTRATLAF